MVPYILLLIFITLLGLLLCEWKKSKRNNIIFLSISSLVMLAMSIVRAKTVGVDYHIYLEYFSKVRQNGLNFLLSRENTYLYEPGYGFLNYLISLVSDNQMVFAGVIGAIMIGLTAALVYRYSSSVWISIFVFISFGFFGYTLVTIRQQMAICIYMFAIPYLQNKKFVPYLLITVLAAMFHKSLWFLIPIYFIAWIQLNWKSLAAYSAGTVLVLLFTDPMLNLVTKFIFKGYSEHNYYRAVGRNFQTAFIPFLLFVAVLILKKKILEHNPRNLPLISFIVYSNFLFILTLKSFIFQRFALIFLPAAILLIPEILNSVAVDESKYTELEQLKNTDKNKKKQLYQKYIDLKLQLRDEKALYYAAIGFILFGGFSYFLFILIANRLDLIPYVTLFK